MKIRSFSPKGTISLGRKFFKALAGQDVVVLEGDLGGGKTTFVQGVLRAAGYKKNVLSPSFTLVRLYRLRGLAVCHVDLYRLESEADIYSTGIEDYLYSPKVITLIEWGEKIERMLPKYIKVKFEYLKQDSREITFSAKGYGKAHKVPGTCILHSKK